MTPGVEETLVRMVGDLKDEVGHIRGTVEATLEQAQKTNGRVTTLEGKVVAIEGKIEHEAGAEEERSTQAQRRSAWNAARLNWINQLMFAISGGIAGSALYGAHLLHWL